jgi:N-acetylglucosaminyldiphosphoundecaprenol N-acetyl-beta-D-mannosaminyltransferase
MLDRIQLLNMEIDPLTLQQAVAQVRNWIDQRDGVCRYVVTPNVQHSVLIQEHAGLRAAYADAGLVLADGLPVVMAARLLRQALPERVPGSDLVPALLASATAERRLRVFLLGAAPGVAIRAAARIAGQWPAVEIVGTHSPPLGFEHEAAHNAHILSLIRAAAPDVLIVGLGAPKQELWVHRYQVQIAAPVALCVGATIDFLAGEKRRAPRWMQRVGLEWLHRCLCEPRRLAKRYLHDAVVFPRLVWRQWRQSAGTR